MIPVHPAANEFPMMEGSEFDKFVEDIRKHGQRDAVWIWNGFLLDGRNRAKACEQIGIDIKTRQFDGDEEGALDLIMSENVHRRHMSKGALALIGGAMDERYREIMRARQAEGANKTNAQLGRGKNAQDTLVSKVSQASSDNSDDAIAAQAGIPKGTKLREHIGKQLDIAPAYVSHGKKVLKDGDPRLQTLVKSDRINILEAARIASLPMEDQDVCIAEIVSTKKGARTRPATNNVDTTERDGADNAGAVERGGASLWIATAVMVKPPKLPQTVLLRCETLTLFERSLPVVLGWGYRLRGILTWDRGHERGPEYWPILAHGKNVIEQQRIPVAPVDWTYRRGETPNEHLDILRQLQPND